MNRSPLRGALALGLVAAYSLLSTPAVAEEEEPSLVREGSTGVGAALITLAYAPLKLAYASGGLVIAGLAWAWTGGNADVSGPIYRSSVGGDYVITPGQITRDEPFTFAGR